MTSAPLSAWPPAAAQCPATSQAPLGDWRLFRYKLAAHISRLLRWEFWPAWAIYSPLVPYLAYLALRYRGITTCTLANPGIPLGGLVGESKWNILKLLPQNVIVPTTLIEPAPLAQRVTALKTIVRSQRWSWPIILKPDVGERGTGVTLIRNEHEARIYLRLQPAAVLAQSYHPGPYEAGVFYVRMPGESAGRIFSLTNKRFPAVTGDGRSSIRTLIWRHPRYRVQASVFLNRLANEADRIPTAGERVQLGFMGNHCRGSMFLDGTDFITPELTAAIDAIAHRTPGFYFGRFDIRYSNLEVFKAGRDFRIVELNGLLSESTNIYDPAMGFWLAQAILRRQWHWAYRIGEAIRNQGAKQPGLTEVLAECHSHIQGRRQRAPERQAPENECALKPEVSAWPVPAIQNFESATGSNTHVVRPHQNGRGPIL